MKGICNKHERVTGYKKGPQFGTVDLRVELIPRTPPTPEKFQRKARLRRLKQQRRMASQLLYLSDLNYQEILQGVEADYAKRG
jgi:hypothetical protein